MSMVTILLLTMTVWIVYHLFKVFQSQQFNREKALRKLKYGRSIGLFALIVGILGQLIGFYNAFSVIEKMGEVAPALVYGGIKVSMITTLYGIAIYLFSIALWFVSSIIIENK